MFRFTIRDVLWLTVVVALLCGWWLDRSKLVWSYGKARETIANLREKLDRADPRGDFEPRPIPNWPMDRNMGPGFSLVLGLALFFLAGLLVFLQWRRIPPTLFNDRRRL
jgi:hypothetical protein